MRFIRCLIVVSVIALATTTPTTSTTAQTAPDSTPVPKVALVPPVAQITKQPLTELASVDVPAPAPAPAPAATYSSDHNTLMAQAGISTDDFGYAAELIAMEDQSWDVHATNPTSGAYGIPQSLPAEKMASAGADWRDNPVTQLRWMQIYVKGSYGTWAAAVSFHISHNWY